MANEDLFSFPEAGPVPPDQANLKSQWDGFLADPRAQGAILQMGLNLLQPVGFGQTPVGAIGSAIGAGGEQVARRTEEERKQQETESRGTLREAQAGLAGARAETAGARADLSSERLRYQRDKLESDQEKNRATNIIRAQNSYRIETDRIRSRNQKRAQDKALGLGNEPAEPVPSWDEWAARNGPLFGIVGSGSASAGDTTGGGTSDPTMTLPRTVVDEANKPVDTSKPPKVGDVVRGYEFLGGDPASPKSWKKR